MVHWLTELYSHSWVIFCLNCVHYWNWGKKPFTCHRIAFGRDYIPMMQNVPQKGNNVCWGRDAPYSAVLGAKSGEYSWLCLLRPSSFGITEWTVPSSSAKFKYPLQQVYLHTRSSSKISGLALKMGSHKRQAQLTCAVQGHWGRWTSHVFWEPREHSRATSSPANLACWRGHPGAASGWNTYPSLLSESVQTLHCLYAQLFKGQYLAAFLHM